MKAKYKFCKTLGRKFPDHAYFTRYLFTQFLNVSRVQDDFSFSKYCIEEDDLILPAYHTFKNRCTSTNQPSNWPIIHTISKTFQQRFLHCLCSRIQKTVKITLVVASRLKISDFSFCYFSMTPRLHQLFSRTSVL